MGCKHFGTMRELRQSFSLVVLVVFLCVAVCTGDEMGKEELDLEGVDQNGTTHLMRAAYENQLELAGLLVQRGAKLEARNSMGATALMVASMRGHTDMVKILLEAKADANARGADGWGALGLSIASGNPDVVTLLIKHGADPNMKSALNRTPLLEAAMAGQLRVVGRLVEGGADLNVQTELGRTPVMEAARKGHKDVVQLLIDHGADVLLKNKSQRTALAQAKDPAVMKLLKRAQAEQLAKLSTAQKKGLTSRPDVNQQRREQQEETAKEKQEKTDKRVKKQDTKIKLRIVTSDKVSQANVKQDATLAEVMALIAKKTKIPVEEQVLNLKLPEGLEELQGDPEDPIEELGVLSGSEIEVSRKGKDEV